MQNGWGWKGHLEVNSPAPAEPLTTGGRGCIQMDCEDFQGGKPHNPSGQSGSFTEKKFLYFHTLQTILTDILFKFAVTSFCDLIIAQSVMK